MTEQTDQSNSRRELILMRHAKSDWGDESLADHDRPLNQRGRRDAPRMARWLAEEDLVPELVLVSSSQRTRETISLMIDVWRDSPTIVYREQLYHSSPGDILATVGGDAGAHRRVMVLAHNPGMSSLVSHFAGEFTDMPTAAVAIFELTSPSWVAVNPGTSARLIDLLRPKDWVPLKEESQEIDSRARDSGD